MTGPEHYREAEKLAANADIAIGQFEEHGYESKRDIAAVLMAEAQVHATLALAAATALGREGEGRMMPGRERQAWFDVAAEHKKEAAA